MQTPSRVLPLTGTSNFRDLGGYVGDAGRTVRWRKIFRSDHLGALTPDDIGTLSALGLARVCDFRGPQERAEQVCAMPGVTVHSLAIEPSVVQGMKDLMDDGRHLTPQDTVRLMEQTYHEFVHRNAEQYAELFALLLQSDAPLVFHCTAGKDRTGFAAAMVLLALGVPRPEVMQDYLLTNTHYRMPQPVDSLLSPEVRQVLWRVQEGFLDAALEAVDTDFGGVRQYLARQLHVGAAEQKRLEQLYLQG